MAKGASELAHGVIVGSESSGDEASVVPAASLRAGFVGSDSDEPRSSPLPRIDRQGVFVCSSSSDGVDRLPDSQSRQARSGRGRGWNRKSLRDCIEESSLSAREKKRLRHALEQDDRKQAVANQANIALQDAWDSERLHAGLTVSEDAAVGRHPRSWNDEPVVRLGFESVGQTATAAARSETHNSNAAGEVVAWAATQRTRRLVQRQMDVWKSSSGPTSSSSSSTSNPRWLYCQRALDASPVDVEFGKLKDILYNAARYHHRDDDGLWTLLPYEEARRLRMRMRRGVLELLGQTAKLVWPEFPTPEFRSTRIEDIILAPVFLENSGASNQMTAFDEILPELSLDELLQMTKHLRWALEKYSIGSPARSFFLMFTLLSLSSHWEFSPPRPHSVCPSLTRHWIFTSRFALGR